MTFDRIRALIESDQLLALGEVLKSLTPDERKTCAKELVAYEKAHRKGDNRWEHGEPLAIAGAGLLPSASTLAPWLLRYQILLHYRTEQDPAVITLLDVLRYRDLPWMPELIAKLAAKMPSRERWRQDLTKIIVEFCGDEPPDTDGFLLHLMDSDVRGNWRPAYDALVPHMLQAVGSGAVLNVDRRGWPKYLHRYQDRQVLLDGSLARLQQGGAVGEMDGFLKLHETLKVTLDETEEHARDYLALLPDSRSTVAGLAQSRLKALDEAERLDFDLLIDASRWVFGRTEKKLVRTQLTWIAQHAKANPDEVVLTVAELFGHESDDLRGLAVKLIVKHLGNTSDATQAEIRTRAEHLPADLAQQLGTTTTQDDAMELAAFVPRPFPAPIETLDELTGELMSVFGRNSAHLEPSSTERIIAAIVRFAWQDREALGNALQVVCEKHPWIAYRSEHPGWNTTGKRNPYNEFVEVIIAARARPARLKKPVSDGIDFARDWKTEQPGDGEVADELACRLHEIARGLTYLPKPDLVSTPTEMSGLIDPAALAERLARAEAEGWEPWRRDLEQALHRLPCDTDATPFAQLTSKAAGRLRDWLATRTDPVVSLVERTFSHSGYEVKDTGLYAVLTPGLDEPEKLLRHWDDQGPMIECWPSTLPAQREIVAAHLVPHLRARTATKGADGPLLPMLAECDGPAGEALHLALVYGLGAELTLNRAHAVDAVLVLEARGQLDGGTLGALLGQALAGGDVVLNRVLPGLRDAARSGAAQQIWHALAALLPSLWSHNRVSDVIELAVELAQRLQPGGEIDGLAEVAARKGSGKAVVQARRLRSALGGTA
ncbi:DUF6493 family protein [Lentzea cavernae]|uniref:Uncharacterized protein n=1 Tax=Lentzea cavernae TaxID=2020703 RepID=A0ABQ3MEX4_9PSEU|nr:DUF6493 family protein [Lentzea cavernae]GHH33856.1 hypothetical protein GCM10017774_16990 [Lentzea cavernae]